MEITAAPETDRHPLNPDQKPDGREAFAELVQIAHRRFGAIPAELLATHVQAVTAGGDWPVAKGAMEALLRRRGFGRRDELVVAGRPARRRALGVYETRRKGRGGRSNKARSRPYRTLLTGVDPPSGSCDCPDYQRSGLGLCKHLLVVLEDLAAKPRRWSQAEREQADNGDGRVPRLTWDPVRPLLGRGDWLERVRLYAAQDGGRRPTSKTLAAVRPRFGADDGGPLELVDAHHDHWADRLALVQDLRAFLRAERRRPVAGAYPSDPALAPLLDHEAAKLERHARLQPVDRRLGSQLKRLKRKAYPYQIEGVRRFLQTGVLLLADDMGLGKTVQAIAACHALWHSGEVRRVLVVVPASLKTQWQREWQACTDVPVTVVDGSPEQRAAVYRRHRRRGVLVVNYEQVIRDLPLMHRFKPDLMVLDEAQRIKNWATKTATYIKRLEPAFRLVLTGTPMENRLEELASIMDWVDDRAIEPKWRLGPWHTISTDGRRSIGGARNLATLRERLAPCLFRRVRREVLEQLPERTDTQLPVPMTGAQQEAHDELDQPIAQIMQRSKRRPLTQAEFLRLMQLLTSQRILCNGIAQRDFAQIWPAVCETARPDQRLLQRLESPKLLEFRELVDQVVIQQRRKVVVFSQWRRMLELAHWAVADLLRADRQRAVFFTGRENQARRTHNVVDFHDDPAVSMLFCSDAGGVGLNLQRAASCTVNLDLPWNPAVLEQRIGRIYRLGQERPIEVYYLVSETGIEGRIAKLLGDKQALFSNLFDGCSDEVQFDHSGSFLDRLERIVEPVEVPRLDDEPDDDDDLTAGGDPAADDEPGLDAPAAAATPAVGGRLPVQDAGLREMLTSLKVRRTQAGGISIEAPPEAAETLAAVFAGMADLLGRAASAKAPGDEDRANGQGVP